MTGLYRAAGYATTQPIERSHVPIKDRVRPMRGVPPIATGQRLAEGVPLGCAEMSECGTARPVSSLARRTSM